MQCKAVEAVFGMRESCASMYSACLQGLQMILSLRSNVGRERKFTRQLKRASKIRRTLSKSTCTGFACSKQHRNVQVAARVRCPSMKLGDEYDITDVVLGAGMSGSVMLGRRKGLNGLLHSPCSDVGLEPKEFPIGVFEPVPEVAEPTPPLQEAHAGSVPNLLDDMAAEGEASVSPPNMAPAPGLPVKRRLVEPCASVPKSKSDSVVVAKGGLPATSSGTPEWVAVKTLDKQGLSEVQRANLVREVEIYLKMDHINIVKLLRVFDEPGKVYLVMEYCNGGDLCDRLAKLRRFPDSEAASAILQVLSAVNYCHRHPSGKVCHRDLKNSNFIFASDAPHAPLKLVDFGLSRVLSPDNAHMRSCAGTVEYMAPEVLLRKKYDESCDMWSVGVIAYSLLCGKAPFFRGNEENTMKAITEAKLPPLEGRPWEGVSEPAKDFVRQLLQANAASRPTAEQALQNAWVTHSAPKRSKVHGLVSMSVLDKVRRFAHENHVRRAVAAMLVYSDEGGEMGDREHLIEAFRELDVDGDGVISVSELVQGLRRALGIPHSEAQWIFNQLDTDGDARIHFHEFTIAATGASLLRQGDIRETFRQFDLDRNGTIELPELERMLGTEFCGTPTHQIFAELDSNGDNSVDLTEFSSMLRGRSPVRRAPLPPGPELHFHMDKRADVYTKDDVDAGVRSFGPSRSKTPPATMSRSPAFAAKGVLNDDKTDQSWSWPIEVCSWDDDSCSNVRDSVVRRLPGVPRSCSTAARVVCSERTRWRRGISSDAGPTLTAKSVYF